MAQPRLALKQRTVAATVRRCLDALPERPGVVVLAGGGAEDHELLRTTTEALLDVGTVVVRADVAGHLGPRYAVARGLVEIDATTPDRPPS